MVSGTPLLAAPLLNATKLPIFFNRLSEKRDKYGKYLWNILWKIWCLNGLFS